MYFIFYNKAYHPYWNFDNKISFILYLDNLSSSESMAGRSIAIKSPFQIDSAH